MNFTEISAHDLQNHSQHPRKKERTVHLLMNKRIKKLVYLYNEILSHFKRKEISTIVMTCMVQEAIM